MTDEQKTRRNFSNIFSPAFFMICQTCLLRLRIFVLLYRSFFFCFFIVNMCADTHFFFSVGSTVTGLDRLFSFSLFCSFVFDIIPLDLFVQMISSRMISSSLFSLSLLIYIRVRYPCRASS